MQSETLNTDIDLMFIITSDEHYCKVIEVKISLLFSSVQQRKESETQCQTDSKFELDSKDPKEVVITETRPSEYVSR